MFMDILARQAALMMPQPVSEASITRTPSRSMAAFSAAPTRVIPPASRPDSANARSFVEALNLASERTDAVDRRREHAFEGVAGVHRCAASSAACQLSAAAAE